MDFFLPHSAQLCIIYLSVFVLVVSFFIPIHVFLLTYHIDVFIESTVRGSRAFPGHLLWGLEVNHPILRHRGMHPECGQNGSS